MAVLKLLSFFSVEGRNAIPASHCEFLRQASLKEKQT
jgi:hypothetical protein